MYGDYLFPNVIFILGPRRRWSADEDHAQDSNVPDLTDSSFHLMKERIYIECYDYISQTYYITCSCWDCEFVPFLWEFFPLQKNIKIKSYPRNEHRIIQKNRREFMQKADETDSNWQDHSILFTVGKISY